jgi:hypothetical protein
VLNCVLRMKCKESGTLEVAASCEVLGLHWFCFAKLRTFTSCVASEVVETIFWMRNFLFIMMKVVKKKFLPCIAVCFMCLSEMSEYFMCSLHGKFAAWPLKGNFVV